MRDRLRDRLEALGGGGCFVSRVGRGGASPQPLCADLHVGVEPCKGERGLEFAREDLKACGAEIVPLLADAPESVVTAALAVHCPPSSPAYDWQIRTGLASPDPRERVRAVERCPASLDHSLHFRPLFVALDDPAPEVRDRALDRIERLGPPWTTSAVPQLERLAERDPILAERAAAVVRQARATRQPDGRSVYVREHRAH